MHAPTSVSIAFLLLVMRFLCVKAWTSPADLAYQCWPSFVTTETAVPFPKCVGITAQWTSAPPDSPSKHKPVDIAFRVDVNETEFYDWAEHVDAYNDFKKNFFAIAPNSTSVQSLCTTSCGNLSEDATASQCCLHRVTVRLCPRYRFISVKNKVQAPCNGTVYLASPKKGRWQLGSYEWTATVTDLTEMSDSVAVVVHFEIGDMVMTLSKLISFPRGFDIWLVAVMVAVAVAIVAMVTVAVVFYLKGSKIPISMKIPMIRSSGKGAITDWRINSEDITEDHSDKQGICTWILAPIAQDVSKRHSFIQLAVHGKFGQVAVRKIRRAYVDVDESMKKNLIKAVNIVHTNVCRIYGVVIEPGNICVISEFCQKCGLNGVLAAEEIPLTWDFRLHFALEVCRGVAFLHSRKIYHGRLKTSNCLVDEKLAIKVADWGLSAIRTEDPAPDQIGFLKRHAASRLYHAPEYSDLFEHEPTAAGDTYAFGIVLTEIATRRPPNGDTDPEKLSPYWKPPLPNLDIQPAKNEDVCPCAREYLDIIDECLQDVFNLRPTFQKLSTILSRLYNPHQQDPHQITISMLARYSCAMETVIAAKKQACEEDKKRVLKLMSNLVPPFLVEKLYEGIVPCAKTYDLCSVYFSDIVGFTTMASLSAPCEVVHTLNLLYRTLDNVVQRYDAWTVELITDAYLIVSGLSKPNSNHALELASMSIAMVDACQSFAIPHRVSERLKIRIGLHSGPLSGGIVGNTVQKFCVFGETINVASKMGSTGKANRIHISEFTYDLLCATTDQFQFERRGTVPFKGRQEMTTWWLTRREPDPSPERVSASVSACPHNDRSETIANDDIDVAELNRVNE